MKKFGLITIDNAAVLSLLTAARGPAMTRRAGDPTTMPCPICNHDEFWQVASQQDPRVAQLRARYAEETPYEWRLCKACANGYPSHAPDRRILQELWALNRTDETADAAAKEKIWTYRRHIAVLGGQRSYRLFSPLVKASGRFLDIGCGLGETVRAFANRGWDAEGIDADPTTTAIHRKIGIKARIGQFEDFEFTQTYDIIHIAHAIYFITDPMRFMRAVRDHLAQGGLLCVVIADFLSNTDAGEPGYPHTFYPTGNSMRFALALAGYDVIFSKRLAGSVFIAARPADHPPKVAIWPVWVRLRYCSRPLRYRLLGRPYLLLRRIAKQLLGRSSALRTVTI